MYDASLRIVSGCIHQTEIKSLFLIGYLNPLIPPAISERRNKTMKMQKITLAVAGAPAAIPPNPNNAATRANADSCACTDVKYNTQNKTDKILIVFMS